MKFNLLLLEEKEELLCELQIKKLKVLNPVYLKDDHSLSLELTSKIDPYLYINIDSS